MKYDFEDILSVTQVSEDFAFDDVENVESTPVLEELDTPIKDLKVIILSIDWEITHELMDKYQQEIKRLEELWKDDNIALAFLRILGSLGIYIKTCQGSSNPEAVKLLYSVYNGLEKTIVSKGMSTEEKVELVQEELRKYNIIRDSIKQANAEAAKRASAKKAAPDTSKDELEFKEVTSETPVQGEAPEAKKTSAGQEAEEITPALASVPASDEEASRQNAFQEAEEDSDLAGRLSDFFGEDDTVETEGGVGVMGGSAGAVPLSASEPDGEVVTLEESVPEQEAQGDTESSAQQDGNIFDDLFSSKPSTPADDLLLQMHMPEGKKGDETQPQAASVESEESEQTADDGSSNEEIRQRLDSFFGDDGADATEGQIATEDGVVTLQPSQSESLSFEEQPEATLAESESPVEDEAAAEVVPLADEQSDQGDAVSSNEEISQRLDSFFGEDEGPGATEVHGSGDGVVPLQPTQTAAGGLDSESVAADEKLPAISHLKEIISEVETSVSPEVKADFAESVKEAVKLLCDNRAALMLVETLGSSFTSLCEADAMTPERIARLTSLCDLVEKVRGTAQPLAEPDLAEKICEEMRSYIALQDEIIAKFLADK